MKGLLCDIYEGKKIGNCSNYGISSKCKWVVLTGEGIPEIFEPNDEHPEVKLIIRDDLKLRSGHAFVNKNNEIKRIGRKMKMETEKRILELDKVVYEYSNKYQTVKAVNKHFDFAI